MKKEEKTIQSNIIYKGKILTLNNDEVLCPNGNKSYREIIHHHGGVCILCLVDNKVIMTKQYRYAYQEELYELPAGKLEKDEDSYQTGLRELEEETGYKAESLTDLGVMYPTCGYSDEIIHLYSANNVTKVDRHLDDDEVIELFKFSIDEILQMIDKGLTKDKQEVAHL